MRSLQYEKDITKNALESVYEKGYQDGKEISAKEREQMFNHGLDAAWEAACWILKKRSEEEYKEINEFFGVQFTNDVFKQMTPQEVVQKIQEFNKSREIVDPYIDLEVGDQIILEDETKAIVFIIEESGYFDVITEDNQFVSIPPEEAKSFRKTGRHFESIKQLVEKYY